MKGVDYLVASLPSLSFDGAPSISYARFVELCGGEDVALPTAWYDLEAQLRNAIAAARHGERHQRPTAGCSVYWTKRVTDAMAEKDVLRRETLLDRVWWDAAGELVPPASPLGLGALQAYAIRLRVALKRQRISTEIGNAAFDRLTAETRMDSL